MEDDYESVADLYDHVTPYASRPDVRFYVELATEAHGRVLEIGCGTGRVLIPTARAGVDIVGLDASPAMLAICRKRLAEEAADVRARASVVQGDMRAFDLLGPAFALITIPFRPFQHLVAVDDQLRCLGCIRRHLAPGGRLVLDVFNPYLEALASPISTEESAPDAEFTMPDGRRVVRTSRIRARDRFGQVNDVELVYRIAHADGREERHVHAFSMRYLFRFELEHLLARAGFEVEHVYADFERRPFGSVYPGDLVIVAKKLP